MRNIRYFGVGLLALGLASEPASAQETGASPAPETQRRVEEKVVVTARRRDENLVDVPISVMAFNASQLQAQNIERVQDLERITPTLRITPTSSRRNTSAVELRGIGNVDTSVTQDIATAFYQNEVVQSRPVGLNQSLYDIESVQVLLGPQGTLFGRNATAGAVLVTSKRPTDTLGGEIGATVGDYNRRDVFGVLNAPLTDELSIRIAGQRLTRDGYTKNVTNGEYLDDEEVSTLRISALYEPTSRFENLLVVDYYDSESNGTGASLYKIRPCPSPTANRPVLTCIPSFSGPLNDAFEAQQARGPRRVAYNSETGETATAWGFANITTYELTDTIVLKNIAGYRDIELTSFADHDATPLDFLSVGPVSQSGNQWSNELQLQGEFASQLDWIVGAYYFVEEVEELSTSYQLGSPVSSINNGLATNTSSSVFAQGTWRLPWVEGLSLTGGGRFTRDEREVELSNRRGDGACRIVDENNIVIDPCLRKLGESFDQPTWLLSLDYKPTDDVLLYIAHRRGYRAGGFNLRATSLAQSQAFDPETVTDIEIGAKVQGTFAGTRVRASLAAYQNSYDDIQRTVSGVLGGIVTTSVLNAAKAEINGLEASAELSPFDDLTLSGYWGYVDAKHTEFNAVVDGVPTVLRDVPFGVSEHNLGGAISWTPIHSRFGDISTTLSVSARSDAYSQQNLPTIEPESRIGWQQMTNLSVEWTEVGGHPVDAQFFVRNLFDQDYVQSVLSLSGQLGFTNRVYAEPRMAGLKLTYRWGSER